MTQLRAGIDGVTTLAGRVGVSPAATAPSYLRIDPAWTVLTDAALDPAAAPAFERRGITFRAVP